MNAVVYQTLRDEMTSYYTSMRNFELGQYGVVVVVFSVIITESSLALIAMKALAIIGFIFMITNICTELHNKATRIGSYIFVAYEMNALKSEKEDFFKYWILANRSSSFCSGIKGEKDKAGFRRNLAKFYFRQILTILFFWLLANFMLWHTYASNLSNSLIGITDAVAIILFELAFVASLIFIRKDRDEAEDYGKKQTIRWQKYCDKRKETDSCFLSEVSKTS
jgi:hypothetical protein